mgnify:CR=1 FL=1
MNKRFILFFILITNFYFSQNVNIPDVNFKNHLLGIPEINLNGDNEIQVSEANSFSGILTLTDKDINDLSGIEHFISLQYLYCNKNNLKRLDLTKNKNLIIVRADQNQLEEINVTKLTELTVLSFTSNLITAIDLTTNLKLKTLSCRFNNLTTLNLDNNLNLTSIDVQNNKLTSLDLSNNKLITDLWCSSNLLSSLNLSFVELLKTLDCSNNNLISLDISKNKNLVNLFCSNNKLTELTTSQNIMLKNLGCTNNEIKELDLSKNINLETIFVLENKLLFLNIANGNNNIIKNFSSIFNPSLLCINIDQNFTPPTDGTWSKDSNSNYNTNCFLKTEELQNSNIEIFPNPVFDYIHIKVNSNNIRVNILDLTGKLVLKSTSKKVFVGNLPKNIYMIQVKTDGRTYNKKIIKK